MKFFDSFDGGFGRDAEFLVQEFGGCASAVGRHADESTVIADEFFPAHFDGSFDGDAILDRSGQDRLAVFGALLEEESMRGNADDAPAFAFGFEHFVGVESDVDFRSRSQEDVFGVFVAHQDIGAFSEVRSRAVDRAVERATILTRKRQTDGAFRGDGKFECFERFVCIVGTNEDEIGNRA